MPASFLTSLSWSILGWGPGVGWRRSAYKRGSILREELDQCGIHPIGANAGYLNQDQQHAGLKTLNSISQLLRSQGLSRRQRTNKPHLRRYMGVSQNQGSPCNRNPAVWFGSSDIPFTTRHIPYTLHCLLYTIYHFLGRLICGNSHRDPSYYPAERQLRRPATTPNRQLAVVFDSLPLTMHSSS